MIEIIKNSNIFDEKWYRSLYPDIRDEDIDAAEHYLNYGGFEGRDPGPSFSTSGYLKAHPDVSITRINPLVHYLKYGKLLGRSPLSIFEGARSINDAINHNILVCGHLCGTHVFGAEKSLIDVLKALADERFNIFLTLPCVGNPQYVADACKLVHKVIILPYFWWHHRKTPCSKIQNNFESIISEFDINLVYVNTITLFEPLLAANKLNIPNVIHARELPAEDHDLCNLLKSDPYRIKQHIGKITNNIIANSNVVAKFFNNTEKISVIPNVIDADLFDIKNEIDYNCFKIGLISSNIPKKGIYDFIELARLFDGILPEFRFLMIGPLNYHIRLFKEKQKNANVNDRLPLNLDFCDYTNNSVDAISQVNVLLNLSHFQESFGRTVLEAMASRRPVICYDWGALPELVDHNKTGYLVPVGNIEKIKKFIIKLYNSPEIFKSLGNAGRRKACNIYNPKLFQTDIAKFIERIFKQNN